MNFRLPLIISLCLTSLFSSCIQDEAPNAEADIYTCIVPDLPNDIRSGSEIINISRSSHEVNIWIKPGSMTNLPDEITLSPTFTLTEGASIIPASGTPLTFKRNTTNPYEQHYTVTSQDKQYYKDYKIRLKESSVFQVFGNARTFHFENSKIHEKEGMDESTYHIFYDVLDENGEIDNIWESANAGFAITNGRKAKTEDYPTYNSENGYSGKCVRLKTSLVGTLGKIVNMPMAAGNFFIGSFDKANAMKSALTSTKFGIITYRVPKTLDFYYKFKRGEKFTNEKLETLNELDYPDAYAVLFRPFDRNGKEKTDLLDKDATLLDGTSILPDKSGALGNIVAVAKWDNFNCINENDLENATFHHVSIPFDFVEPYTSINKDDLKAGKYYLTLVFTSSYKGDYFYGAEGSTLYVDEATITFEPEE